MVYSLKQIPAVFAACLVAALAASAAARDLTTLVPPDAETAVYIRSVPAALKKIRSSPFGGFYRDPSSEEFLAPLKKTVEGDNPEIAAIMSAGIGGEEPALLRAMTGEAIAARLPPASKKGRAPKKDDDRRDLVIFEHNDPAAALAFLLKDRWPEGAEVVKTPQTLGELTYYHVRASWKEAKRKKSKQSEKQKEKDRKKLKEAGLESDDGGLVRGVAVAERKREGEEDIYVGPTIAIRASADGGVIRDAIKRMQAPRTLPTLGESARRRGAIAALKAPPEIEVYYDFRQLAEGGEPLIDPELLGRDGNVERLGAAEIKSAALGLFFAEDRLKTDVNIYVPQPRQGVGKLLFINKPLLEADASPTTPTVELRSMIPADSLGYAMYGADIEALWNEFRLVFGEGAPGLLKLADDSMGALRKTMDEDVIGGMMKSLGARWAVFTRPAAVKRGMKTRIDSTFIFEVKSGRRLRPTLDRWLRKTARSLNYSLDESDVGDFHFYRFAGAEVSEGALVDIEPVSKICLTPKWLIVSSRFEHIEAAIARSKAPEARTPAWPSWERGVAGLAPVRCFELYSPPSGYRDIGKNPFHDLFNGVLGGFQESLMDYEKAPDEATWTRYFDGIVGGFHSERDHVTVSFQVLYKEGAR